MKSTRTKKNAPMPVLPIDLRCRREAGAGAPLKQFIQARWRVTTALLRTSLRRKSAGSAFSTA